jgi:hypothetical protein
LTGEKISSAKIKKSKQRWARQPSGILIPSGRISDISIRSKTNHLETKACAKQIEDIYEKANIQISNNSGLGELIKTAKDLSDNWLPGNKNNLGYHMFFLSMHLARIAESLLLLNNEKNKDRYLRELLSGSLNFFKRGTSHAKDIFWEIEAWAKIKKRLDSVYLQEPPDIVVDYDDSQIGISCKKLYTENHVQNVLSQAVQQIEKGFEFGIVAVNIDDLLPADVVLKMGSSDAVIERLNQINTSFINRHVRHFSKYFSASRIISAIVSTSIIADVPSEKPRFSNTYQWTVWAVTELKERHKIQLNKFYQTIMN